MIRRHRSTAKRKSEKMKLDKSRLELVLREKGKYFDTAIKHDPRFNHLKEIHSIIFEDSLFLVEN